MMELVKRQRMDARMPPLEDVLKAVRLFVKSKQTKRQAITDSQARLVQQSLEYCFKTVDELQQNIDKALMKIYLTNLRSCAAVLHGTTTRTTVTDAHVDLARFLYERSISNNLRKKTTSLLVHILSLSGYPRAARDLLLQAEQGRSTATSTEASEFEDGAENDRDESLEFEQADERAGLIDRPPKMWQEVLDAFVLQRTKTEVERTFVMIKERGYDRHRDVAVTMIEFCMQQKDVEALKQWWTAYHKAVSEDPGSGPGLRKHEEAAGRRFNDMLSWCLKENQIQLGHQSVRDVMANNPPKPFWDAIFVWAAGTNKSVDEIGRMMSVMEKSNEQIVDRSEWRQADIVTINSLVEFAISLNDPYMAERFIALGRERNIEPDARTLVLQMEYRLKVGDVDGALIAYKALVEHKNATYVDESFAEDISAINRLIVALCGTQRHDFDTIMNVTMDLADRRAPFEAETVSTLALLHLARDEADDATDLLNTHSYHFSSTDRTNLRNAIMKFAVDPKTSTSRAWSSYNILRDIFDETPRDDRTELMTSFFNRERADMAVRIFQHMRMHSRADTIPKVDTYVAAFMGLAKLRDIDSVEIVHNQLKLDYNITITTYLRNALIIAYTAGDKGRKALGFWDDIVASKEGPSYNSIHIALRACEKSPFGDLRAKELWALLRRRNVELDQALWASYVAALAGNGDNDSAIHTIEEAEKAGQLEVDAFLLGSLCDGANGQIKQQEIEAWAREKYPVQWEELEGLGSEEDIAGQRSFGIDRRLGP